VDPAAIAEWVWYGRGVAPAAARAALAPAELLFRAGVVARGALYDAGVARARHLGAPALGVGNLTVGGTGKTPVAAWASAQLRARGARPALLLRGVGGDEAQVHALLNPDVPVVADPDRVRGAARAVADGANALVLDDAFQHRRARRDVDLVLVSAERGVGAVRLLPAGPFREDLRALRRASMVVVTRKSAPAAEAERVADALARRCEVAVVQLALDAVRQWPGADTTGGGGRAASGGGGEERPLAFLDGRDVLAVSGVGDPDAFVRQLVQARARATPARFADHHAYTPADVSALVARAARGITIVTTLKDAVKLGPLWPRTAPPLWYVSQRVTVERGGAALTTRLDAVAEAARAHGATVPSP
jgi:tetraacyldisaccharide 4'-kinase